MEYKQIIKELNGLSTAERNTYDQLQAMKQLSIRGGRLDRPASDSELEKTLSALSMERNAKVEATTTGIWFWQREVYAFTDYGETFYNTERANISRISSDIANVRTYKGLDATVDAILKRHGTNPVEYLAKKAIISDELFDDEKGNVFSRKKNIGDYIAKKLSPTESRKQKDTEKYISKNTSTVNTDDSSNLLTYAMLGGILMSDSPSETRGSNDSSTSGCSGGFIASSGCSGGTSSGCSGGSSGCGGGGCGGGGCGGS